MPSRAIRQVVLIVVAVAAAFGASASAAFGASPVSGPGRLVVVVSGLPPGQHPVASLRGPGIAAAIRGARLVIRRARPGRYTITLRRVVIARPWRSVAAGAVATPKAQRIVVSVRARQTTTVNASYGTIVNPRVRQLPGGLTGVRGDDTSPSGLLYAAGAHVPTVGSILLAPPSALLPHGVVARVTGVHQIGGKRLVSVVNVPVSEAVPEFSFTGAADLHPASDQSSPLARKADTTCGGYSFFFDVGASLDQFQIRQASAGLWPPQMSFTLAVRTSEHLGIRAFSASLQCAVDLGQIGPTWRGAIPSPVGPIPVYANIPITLNGSIAGSGPGFRVNHASTHVITLGLGSHNQFDFQEQGENTWTSGTSGGATADISLLASLEFGIGDPTVGNVHLDVGFGPDLTIKPSAGCDLELDLGSVSAGVRIGWFGASTPSWTPFHHHLWHGCAGGGSDASTPTTGGGTAGGNTGGNTGGGNTGAGAAGSGSGSTHVGPMTWSAGQQVDPPAGGIAGVSCPSVSLCVAVDWSGHVLTTSDATLGPSSWQIAAVDTANGFQGGIACPSTTLCLAPDRGGNVLVSTHPSGGAAAWTASHIDPDGGSLTGVSCASPTFCVVADQDGDILTSTNPAGGAASWTATHIDSRDGLNAISCPTSGLCVGVDYFGGVLWSSNPTGGSTAWSDMTLESNGYFGPNGISCATQQLCVALDGSGNILTTTDPTGGPSTWSLGAVDPGAHLANTGLGAVECSSGSSCVALDESGNVLVSASPADGAASWQLGPIHNFGPGVGLSCISGAYCVGIDASGRIAVGQLTNG
jgi:hypothetical protein